MADGHNADSTGKNPVSLENLTAAEELATINSNPVIDEQPKKPRRSSRRTKKIYNDNEETEASVRTPRKKKSTPKKQPPGDASLEEGSTGENVIKPLLIQGRKRFHSLTVDNSLTYYA